MLALALALALPTMAASNDAQVLAALQSSAGWTGASQSKGVTVSTKSIAGMSVPAYRGVRTVDVSCADYFGVVSDVSRHMQASDLLRVSKVVSQKGDSVVFYQVADMPLISDRYWINRAVNQREVDGQAGHFRQTWSALDKDDYPSVRDAVEDKYGAVFTPVNYGFWDLVPAGKNGCTVTYAVVSEPGGHVPSGAGSWASGKSLPNNINGFLEAARR